MPLSTAARLAHRFAVLRGGARSLNHFGFAFRHPLEHLADADGLDLRWLSNLYELHGWSLPHILLIEQVVSVR